MDGYWETPRQGTYPIKTLKRNVFYSIKLRAVNEKVELSIDDEKLLDWEIPTHSDIKLEKDEGKKVEDTIIPIINFRKNSGRIGFRAYQGENVVIKKLHVKAI